LKLCEICNINMGQSPDSSLYNEEQIGMPFYQGNADFGEIHPKARVWCTKPTKIAKSGDILLSVRAPIGALNIANEDCCIGRGLAAITADSNKCSKKYLWYALESKKDELISKGTGSTFKAISKNVLFDTEIPYVPLDEQILIEQNLDKIAQLINNRKKQLDLLSNLVASRFIELFGEPVVNPKGFPCYTVGEVIDFQGGSQPDKKYFEYEPSPDNIRLIQIRDYKSDKYITYIPKTMAKRFCTVDDIMIGRYGPPIFQILKGIEGSFNVALMKATPKMGNREFVRQFLKQDCLLEYLEGLSKRTAGQDGIQMDKLKAYPFPYPPIELQEQFAAFVEQTDKSKLAVQKSLEQLETLKKSLMQKYFG
jgi:type I restriction enzyme S subunit